MKEWNTHAVKKKIFPRAINIPRRTYLVTRVLRGIFAI